MKIFFAWYTLHKEIKRWKKKKNENKNISSHRVKSWEYWMMFSHRLLKSPYFLKQATSYFWCRRVSLGFTNGSIKEIFLQSILDYLQCFFERLLKFLTIWNYYRCHGTTFIVCYSPCKYFYAITSAFKKTFASLFPRLSINSWMSGIYMLNKLI